MPPDGADASVASPVVSRRFPTLSMVALSVGAVLAGGGCSSGDGASAGDAGGPSTADGAALYESACATCHRPDGSGLVGPSLQGVHDRLSDDEIRTVVLEGRGGRMPAWEGRFDATEVDAIIAHLENFD